MQINQELQKLILLYGGGIFAFLNVLISVKGYFNETPKEAEMREALEAKKRGTFWVNPELNWYQKHFCTGFERSSNCSYRVVHPFTAEYGKYGMKVPEGRPKADRNKIISFSYSVPRTEMMKEKIRLPDLSSGSDPSFKGRNR